VLVTVSDKKVGVDQNSDGMIDYYTADVLSAQDFYPFGFKMPGRQWSNGTYRYGFNGKEQDKEIGEEIYDFGARVYDGRIGRWKSADLKKDRYPQWSPFHFGFNNPITTIDPDGNENIVVAGTQYDNLAGNKLMFVHQALRQLKQYSVNEKDETRTLLIFTQGYTERQLKRIEQQAAKLGATVIRISSVQHLTDYINTKSPNGLPTSKREEDKITNIDAFAHGIVGAIEFGYQINRGNQTNTSMSFTKTSAEALDKKAFAENAVFTSYACRTGLGNPEIDQVKYPWESTDKENSLAQNIADAANITVRAYLVRTDYSNTLSTPLERLDYKVYSQLGPGGHKKWFDEFKKRIESREQIDGATFDPEGALHGVGPGGSPAFVSGSGWEFKPKQEPKPKNIQ